MAYTRSSALYEKLGGVNSYVLAIAKDANFSQDVRNFTTSEAEYKVELAGFEQEYYWKVQAIFLAKYNYGQTVKSALGHFVFTLGGHRNTHVYRIACRLTFRRRIHNCTQ